MGSGFILTPDGMIMTNAHVVDGADEVIVTLTDKREFKAKIIGADKRSDVAVVKIEATGLPAVKVGDVSRLKVGEWVMAIGSPFGLENSVTAGIVSAKQRDTGDYLPFIQTDVAINPGNSGGPLINMRGEVVGINSQIYSRSGGSMGISFAIPMDEAVRVSEQLRATGRVTAAALVCRSNGEQRGGRVHRFGAALWRLGAWRGSGGPADKAGVEAGDIIIKFDGKKVEKSSDLPRMVGGTKPGAKSALTVFRRGASKDLTVTVAEIEPKKKPRKAPEKAPKAAESKMTPGHGSDLNDLTDEVKKELGIKGGVQVNAASGAAARAGLREGDVIMAVANVAVTSVAGFEKVLRRPGQNQTDQHSFRRGEWAQYT